jgi:hypothetical protein
MARILIDTDLLLKNAEGLHLHSENIKKNGEKLLTGILAVGGRYAGLTAQAKRDAYAAQDLLRSMQNSLALKADGLAALARAFRSIDDETVSALLAMRGEDWFLHAFFPAPLLPDIAGFEPYFVPQSRLLLADWVPVYEKGDRGLKQTETFHTGMILDRVVGIYTDPATAIAYFVVDLGGGRLGFIPRQRASARIEYSKIPDREGEFRDGQKVAGSISLRADTIAAMHPGWFTPGQPWQDFILGRMKIAGLGGGSFPMTPHANLCGELSVLFALGETNLELGLSRFAQLHGLGYWNIDGSKTEYTGTQVLQNVWHATSAYDLRRFFEDYGWDARISTAVMPAPDALVEKIRSGRKLVFLTELDTLKETISSSTGKSVPNPTCGQLVPGGAPPTPGRAAHWVMVTDVFQDGGGKIFVQVFNSYSGCEETYSWDTFVKTCQQPGTQTSGSYSYIEAAPPARKG